MSVVYGLGSNGQGQLGIGHFEDVNEPKVCYGLPSEKVLKITGGGNHSAVLTASGRVFMSGLSQSGEETRKKVLMSTLEEQSAWAKYRETAEGTVWKDVACGWSMTVLVSEDGRVFLKGSLLGEDRPDWTEQPMPEPICSVACGWRHIVVLGCSGTVYGWGGGGRGQLGPSGTREVRTVQVVEGVPKSVVQIACGHMFSLLRTSDGTVYGLGSNKHGQLGPTPPIVYRDSTAVDAGWHHSFSQHRSQGLQGLGKRDHGQLDQSLATVSSFCCGSEHNLALKDNAVYGWGWNEHGNCTLDQDFTKAPVVISNQHSIIVLGAGCATSWFACSSREEENRKTRDF